MAKKLEEQHKNAAMRLEIAAMKLDVARVEQTMKIMDQLPSFAQDTDEREWQILGDPNKKTPYTPEQLTSIRNSARKLQYRPTGRSILQTYQDYIIGKDAHITTEDEDKEGEIQEYWDDWALVNSWDMKTKEIVKRVFRDGEVFLRWFMPAEMGEHLLVRFVDPEQIKPGTDAKPTYGIAVDDDDYEKVLYYNRVWSLSNGTQRSERIEPDMMDFWKIGADSDQMRGVSIFQGNGEYITEYEKWLKDRITINRIRHIWNVVGKPLSGLAAIEDLKSKFADVSYNTPAGQSANKKMPKPGTVLFSKGVEWDLKSLNINAADTKDDGRAIQLMAGIGTNIPEFIIRGDASNANLSSSMVSENPFIRSMESGQDFVAKIFQKAYERVIKWGITTNKIKGKSTKTTVVFNEKTGEDSEKVEAIDTVTSCKVNFATMIHRNILEDTKALQVQIGEGLCSRKTASEKLGYDYEDERIQIAREDKLRLENETRNAEEFGTEDNGQTDDNSEDE